MKETFSIPGAGISYSAKCGKRRRKNGETGTRSRSNNIAPWIIGLLALAAVFCMLTHRRKKLAPSPKERPMPFPSFA